MLTCIFIVVTCQPPSFKRILNRCCFLFVSGSRFFLSVECLINDGFTSLSQSHLTVNAWLHFSAAVPLQYSWLLCWLNRSRARQTAIWEKQEVTWLIKPSLKAGDSNTDRRMFFLFFFLFLWMNMQPQALVSLHRRYLKRHTCKQGGFPSCKNQKDKLGYKEVNRTDSNFMSAVLRG